MKRLSERTVYEEKIDLKKNHFGKETNGDDIIY